MDRFAAVVTRHPLKILALVAALSVFFAAGLPLDYDDDVVRFLPAKAPEIATFERISDRFGSLQVALVVVEAADLYTPENLGYVRRLTRDLTAIPETEHVTSITELAVVKDEGGGRAGHVQLVPDPIPADPAGLAALKADLLGLDYIAGSLASTDGTSALLVAQLRTKLPDGLKISTKRAAEALRARAEADPPPAGVRLHFGGAPFIAEAAANGSQADLQRLAPFVAGITLLLVVLSLGSLWAAFYTVLTVGLGCLWTLGLMGWLGLPLTLVSSSLPVVLAALGSAYAVHVLVWYREHGANPAVAITGMGWPIIVTAATTAAGFVSFLAMDLAPMREFGWQMAVGAAFCAVLALTLVPALLVVRPIAARPPRQRAVDRWLLRVAATTRRRRGVVLGVAAAVAVLFATRLSHIDTRMDTGSFFPDDAPPAVADRVLAERFGGSVFLQLFVDADIADPAVLHRLAAFEDRLRAVPGVTRVESIAQVVAIVHEGMKLVRRESRSRAEAEQFIYLAQQADPSVALLVDGKRRGALVQIGIGGFDTGVVDGVVARVQALADEHLAGRAVAVPATPERAAAVQRDAAERLVALTDGRASVDAVSRALDAGLPAEVRADVAKKVADIVQRDVVDDEMVTLADPEKAPALAADLTRLVLTGELDKDAVVAMLRALVDPAELEDERDVKAFERGARLVGNDVDLATTELLAAARRAPLDPLLGELPRGRSLRVDAIVDELARPVWYVTDHGLPPAGAAAAAAGRPVAVALSGEPIIQRAMTESVQRNQGLSLLVGLPLIILIVAGVFRSVTAGLIGVLPAGLTLLVTFGLMGCFPDVLPMDIAASMLSSIALGVGIDYAIHFMWRYRQGGLEAAMRTSGLAIVINAAEITGGFVVLAWATIAPMSRFGLLIAETLLVAAIATLVLLPPLLSWWRAPEARPDEAPALGLDAA
ncbi:MAG: MMPL family transporter [Myxococcales bacterium]|nr:MMPL family transporter [Myxococcales bacterium]MCB9732208.1 MMPL family transporter [Deltaproteobacteria bacterium]